jgi:hypothetical protein
VKPTGQLSEQQSRIESTEKHFNMECTDTDGGVKEAPLPKPKPTDVPDYYAKLFDEIC